MDIYLEVVSCADAYTKLKGRVYGPIKLAGFPPVGTTFTRPGDAGVSVQFKVQGPPAITVQGRTKWSPHGHSHHELEDYKDGDRLKPTVRVPVRATYRQRRSDVDAVHPVG